MRALPLAENPKWLEYDQLLAVRAYVRTLQKLKDDPEEYAKVSPLLKMMPDDEIANLDREGAAALRLLGALPDSLFSIAKPATMDDLNQALDGLVKAHPELKKIANIDDAMKFAGHPAVAGLLQARPELQKLLDQETQRQLKLTFPSAPKSVNRLNLIEKFLKADLDWLFTGL